MYLSCQRTTTKAVSVRWRKDTLFIILLFSRCSAALLHLALCTKRDYKPAHHTTLLLRIWADPGRCRGAHRIAAMGRIITQVMKMTKQKLLNFVLE